MFAKTFRFYLIFAVIVCLVATVIPFSALGNENIGETQIGSGIETLSVEITNDTYYILNAQNCDYIRYSSSTLSAQSGLIADLGDTIRWQIQAVSGGFTVRSQADPTKYLSVTQSMNSSAVVIATVSGTSVPSRCIWDIEWTEAVGGHLIKNTYNNRYLHQSNSGIVTITAISYASVWNAVKTYEMSGKELSPNATFPIVELEIGETATAQVSAPIANFVSPSYFTYSLPEDAHVSINSNGVITALSDGVTRITAIHKVTDLKYYIMIIVGNDYPIYDVKNYADQGFVVRFGSTSYIESANDVVALKLKRIFGLDMLWTLQTNTSYADTCRIMEFGSVTFESLSTHVDDNNCPHEAAHLFDWRSRENPGSGDDVTTKAQWTGHILIGNPPSSSFNHNVGLTPLHVTLEDNGYANVPENLILPNQSRTLMHELSHQLGVDDHYCYGIADWQGTCVNTDCDRCYKGFSEIRVCLMGNVTVYYMTKPESELYCSDCIEIIEDHLSDHHQ